ncbi:hypothetical protein EMMF5_002925 [Cystobasidiomycetes sp. EMM_F5]
MSADPPYRGEPLPDGWQAEWNAQYKQHYFVNLRTNPPTSSWIHPNASQHHAPPAGPPPGAPPQGGPPGGRDPYSQSSPYGGPVSQGGGPNYASQGSYGPPGGQQQRFFGSGPPVQQQPMYAPSQGPTYVQAPQKSHAGRNTALGIGGGLLGGMLLEHEIDKFTRREDSFASCCEYLLADSSPSGTAEEVIYENNYQDNQYINNNDYVDNNQYNDQQNFDNDNFDSNNDNGNFDDSSNNFDDNNADGNW